MFEWKGLPESINERFLELTILEQGKAVFFKDPMLGEMALPVMTGRMNFYNEPVDFIAWSIDYDHYLTADEGVIIWNNYSRTNFMPILEEYARRLYKATRAIDVNVELQKFPMIFLTDESQRLTMTQLMQKFEGNEPFIFGNKAGFNPESVQAINTGIPYVEDKLTLYKHDIWNEAMSFLGIGNANQDKKERLVADEVSANDEQVQSSRYVMLKARQDACEQINKMFGLNVSVDFKLNIDNEVEEVEEDDPNGGNATN
jgi:hypothetical protein